MAKEASPPHPDFRFHRVVACRPRAVHGDAQFYLSSNSRAMSALGQKQTFHSAIVMSALPPKADMRGAKNKCGFGPKATSLLVRLRHRPLISAMTLPQLVSVSSEICLLFATFSTHSGHANSSISGAMRSAAGEMIIPKCRSQLLQVMLRGLDIETPPIFATR